MYIRGVCMYIRKRCVYVYGEKTGTPVPKIE